MGIDGAKQMIAKAKSREGGEYILANLDSFNPTEKFDLFIQWKFCITWKIQWMSLERFQMLG